MCIQEYIKDSINPKKICLPIPLKKLEKMTDVDKFTHKIMSMSRCSNNINSEVTPINNNKGLSYNLSQKSLTTVNNNQFSSNNNYEKKMCEKKTQDEERLDVFIQVE